MTTASNASDDLNALTRPGSIPGLGFGADQFVHIEPGRFTMGSELDADNLPHEVMLRRGFQLQRTPVTQGQWEAVMGSNPSHFSGDAQRPVESVSWLDVQAFIRSLEQMIGVSHRLPTDAEWDYACRAGGTGMLSGDLDGQAWFRGNSGGSTQPVATKPANAWGLYDMHGNVCEWVRDYYSQLSTDRLVDPTGTSFASTRVVRGASWFNQAIVARGVSRGSLEETDSNNMTGFRLVRIG